MLTRVLSKYYESIYNFVNFMYMLYTHTVITCPNTTLSIFSGFNPAVCIAAVEATTDKSVALLFTNTPPIVPNGVRFAATIKTPINKEIQ